MKLYKYIRPIIALIVLWSMVAIASPKHATSAAAPKQARLDGGLVLLITAAVGYGVKNLYKSEKPIA